MKSPKFTVISLFPEMIQQMVAQGVVGQGLKHNIFELEVINPRDFTTDVHKTVDDRPYGGGDGMVLLCEPLELALKQVVGEDSRVIYLSPQGQLLDDDKVKELAESPHIVMICGRYGGIDQRIINLYVDEEVSIGNYVLSGGELAAGVVIDSVARFFPGVLGHQDSAHSDSFTNGFLEAPNFTRPQNYKGQGIPTALLSGNHKLIEEWREKVGQLVTLSKRPELMLNVDLTVESIRDLYLFWQGLSAQERDLLGLSGLSAEEFSLLLAAEEEL